METIITRAQSTEDIAEVARLDKLLDAAMKPLLPGFYDMGEITRNYDGIADGSRGFALLARVDGRCVGMARVVCGNVAMLESLIVEEEVRGIGIGTHLLRAAQGISKERGLPIMMLNVLKGNDGAKSLYEGAGFSEFRTAYVTEL